MEDFQKKSKNRLRRLFQEARIKDIDLTRGMLTVRSGKGDQDRSSIIPESLKSRKTTLIIPLHYTDNLSN